MPHDVTLITTLAAGFGLALVLGFVALRLKLPALVGYLMAGVAIGPFTPGFVGDMAIASQLAEIGVMLLMFGVGLHFSLDDLMAVRKIAVPGAVAQMAVATGLGMGVAHIWGWSLGAGLVFGLSLSVASTVVLLKALEARGIVDSMNGRIAIGWLIVEDLAMVLVLVLLPALAGVLGGVTPGGAAAPADTAAIWLALGKTLLQVALFIALMLVVGRRFFPWLLWQVTKTGSRELFTLCVVAAAVTIAYGSAALFGVSFALGAFFAGMVMRESKFSHRAAEESLPLRDAFAVLFFVSVGMLFDPHVLVDRPLQVLAVVAIIILGKSLVALAVVLLFRYPLNTALTVSASLAQIGEFSFILAGLGVSLKLLPTEGYSLVLAGALISMALNPLVFSLIEPAQRWVRARSELARKLEARDDPLAELPAATEDKYLARQVVLVGYGRVGRHIAEALAAAGIPFVVADHNRERVEALRERGIPAVLGDASEPAVLIQAHIAHARVLVLATPDTVSVRKMIEVARTLNPGIQTLVRSHNEEEAQRLQADGAGRVFLGERELAQAMVREVLAARAH
ncbi:YbaL family putative K(+) efflux transporter [Roseateles toxinivorans]|uniref:Kef-type potassium/proton antiporter (CPA2 family) n=1 Tax=Roseateles toxinivorans TaxID=270368 RepID=A0A4R6QRG4_9BURK|nr:YbaL family putative K(+) efflux transporter [Roseateles toxinivorans]TDP73353.1 Kef-type potassium/proton antiporter (CPA2 family) [Roseateles toxinivorans]